MQTKTYSYEEACKLKLGELRQYMVELGFSSATRLSKRGMLVVLEKYPNGPQSCSHGFTRWDCGIC